MLLLIENAIVSSTAVPNDGLNHLFRVDIRPFFFRTLFYQSSCICNISIPLLLPEICDIINPINSYNREELECLVA